MKKEEMFNKFVLECSCGCGKIELSESNDDGFTFLSYNIPAFYAYQIGIWATIIRRMKIIWNILLGHEYQLYEIVIDNNSELNEFKNFVSNMRSIDEQPNP